MTCTIKKFLACESGATALEYGLLIAAISAVAMAALTHLGDNFSGSIGGTSAKIAEKLDNVSPAAGN